MAGDTLFPLKGVSGQSALFLGWQAHQLAGATVKILDKIERKGLRGRNF
jgi:hypothetical protein